MKKFLIGCGIVFLLMIVCAGGFTIWGVVKARNFAASFQEGSSALMQLDTKYPFTEPPAGEPLEAQRYDEYIVVRRSVIARVASVPLLSQMVQGSGAGGQAQPSVSDVFGMIGEIPKIMKDFAGWLDGSQMSLDEYNYYTISTIQAIGAGKRQGDPELSPIWDELMLTVNQAQQGINQQAQSNPQLQQIDLQYEMSEAEEALVPDENIALVKANLEEFSEGTPVLVVELLLLEIIKQASHQYAPAAGSR